MKWKEFTDKHRVIKAGSEPGYRDEYLNRAIVDVVQRGKDINVIVYLVPGENPARISIPIKKACIDVFGHQKSQNIDAIFYPKGLGLQAGGENGRFDSFCIVIEHPDSLRYDLTVLKDDFTKRLYLHLMDKK